MVSVISCVQIVLFLDHTRGSGGCTPLGNVFLLTCQVCTETYAMFLLSLILLWFNTALSSLSVVLLYFLTSGIHVRVPWTEISYMINYPVAVHILATFS